MLLVTKENHAKPIYLQRIWADKKLSHMNLVTKENHFEVAFPNDFAQLRDSRDAACDRGSSSETYNFAMILDT